jgi:hypoxanthine-guanine phosphoribosyltransferase
VTKIGWRSEGPLREKRDPKHLLKTTLIDKFKEKRVKIAHDQAGVRCGDGDVNAAVR